MTIRPEVMRKLMERKTRNLPRIVSLVESRWKVGTTRPQTREALIDCLCWLPDAVLDATFSEGGIFVIAPEIIGTGSVVSVAGSLHGKHSQLVVLDPWLEALPYAEALKRVQELLFVGFVRIAKELRNAAGPQDAGSVKFSDEDEQFLKSLRVSG